MIIYPMCFGKTIIYCLAFIATTTRGVPTAPGPFDCPAPNGNFASPYSCSQYYVCVDGTAFLYVWISSFNYCLFHYLLININIFFSSRIVHPDFITILHLISAIGPPMLTATCKFGQKIGFQTQRN